jgi:hypothetical protein
VEYTSKVDVIGCERDLVSAEDTQQIELDGQHLVLSLDCHGDFHGPFFILILGWDLLILSYKVFLTGL